MRKLSLGVLFTVLVLSTAALPGKSVAGCGAGDAGPLDAAGVAAWTQDIDAFHASLDRGHIDLYHTISKAEFSSGVASLKQALPSLREEEVVVALMRLSRRIGDGHSSVPLWGRPACRLPLEFRMLDGQPYLTAAPQSRADLLGSRLISLNGVAAPALIAGVSQVVAFAENPYSTDVRTAQQLPNAEILSGLGFATKTGPWELVFEKDGRRLTARLTPSVETEKLSALTLGAQHFATRIAGDDRLSFASDDGGRTVYVGFRRYPDQPAMAAFADKLLDYINRQGTRSLIIDLRGNSGGDFFTGLMLAQRLVLADGVDWKSGVYVLTDNETFSAAMSNAAQFSQLLNARRVGQPTGGKPTGYQDLGEFKLPNSGLVVTYSKRLYRFDPGEEGTLRPDIPVGVTINDYLTGRDPVIERVLSELAEARR